MSYSNFNMRLDDGLKNTVYPVFEHYGLTPSQAVKLFFNQVANTKKIPLSFEWGESDDIPNLTTQQALKEALSRTDFSEAYDTPEQAILAMQEIAHES